MSDAVNTNRAAVNKLVNSNRLRGNTTGELLEYNVKGVKIWHYFDPPHLIKSVRNNLLVKNLTHIVSFNEAKFRPNGDIVWNDKNKQQRTASWNDILEFYKFNSSGVFNLIPKVTEEHINPVRRKMKVILATQVFSGTFGRNMYLCAKRKEFSNDCLGSAAVQLFLNALFDSVNGDDVVTSGKPKGAVTEESEHQKFWDYAIRMLDNMSFSENLITGKPNQSSVLKHFVSTLKGLRRICEHLFELNFKSIGLRRLNQDGLENYFFKIRSYSGSNQMPSSRDFRNSYTTSILNSQLTSHSINANCEADEDKYVVANLMELFAQKNETESSSQSESKNIRGYVGHKQRDHVDNENKNYFKHDGVSTLDGNTGEEDSSDLRFPEDEAQNCVAGEICKQLLRKNKCASCHTTIIATTNKKGKSIEHEIMRKQSSTDEIILPKVEIIHYIKIIISKLQTMLPVLCAEKNLEQKLLAGINVTFFYE